MSKVRNQKAVARLSSRSFRANRTRNFIAAAAIVLTAVLFTTLFTLGMGAVENFQRATLRQVGGDGHVNMKYITDEQYNAVKDSPRIKRISYNRLLSDSVDNAGLLKRHGELYYMDDTGIEMGFHIPTTGRRPEAANEIIADTKTLQLLGVPLEIGAPVTLELTVHGKPVTREFVLSGWWEADPVFNASILVASRAYMQAHLDELQNTYKEDYSYTGVINSYIMLNNTFDLEGQLNALLAENGFQSEDESADNFIGSNVNWAYLSSNFTTADPTAVAAVVGALALIIFTGYLIIYNIFQISVVKDIRFYGLLKTVGTTGKQIKSIILRQALLLSAIGIPIGLLLGFLLGRILVPTVMSNVFNGLGAGQIVVTANPLIFLGSAVFVLITVFLSTRKPGKIAASVSPVEATRYADGGEKPSRKEKKTSDGGKIPRMALSNLARNKKRTVLVVISMTLSLVLLNTVFTVTHGFDMDKYLSKFVQTDFLIANAQYFNYDFSGPDNELSESMIEAVQSQPGFQEGGRFFGNNRDTEYFTAEDSVSAAADALGNGRDDLGNYMCAVYGAEALPLSGLEVVEGELDLEKLATGDYIIEGMQTDDEERPYPDTSHYNIGDQITLHNWKGPGEYVNENQYTTRTFTLLAKVKVGNFTSSDGSSWDYSFYLPSEVYQTMVDDPGLMSYVYNVADSEEAAMDAFLSSYTETAEPTMHFSSKAVRANEFHSMQNTVLLIGGALSLIIGLIGILNFVNSVLTSIVSRRKEFATLEAIGMTNRQLRGMLTLESLYYAAFTAVTAVLLSALLSVTVVGSLLGGMWFVSYQFILWPVLAAVPVLFLLALLVPGMSLRFSGFQSLVERLREA